MYYTYVMFYARPLDGTRKTQWDAKAVASMFVIRVERDDQRAPRPVYVQAAQGSMDIVPVVSLW